MLPSHSLTIAHVIFALLLCVTPSASANEPQPRSDAYRIIVHPDNSATSIERKLLASIFLKRVTQWSDGQVIHVVDLDPAQDVRRRFTREVLGRSVEAVKSYWEQAIFSGRDVPPPELDNSEDVVQYVLAHKGAIGYVAANVDVGAAKPITMK